MTPYTGVDDTSLPDAVKALSDPNKKAQWVEVFNSSYDLCVKDGGDKKRCEPSAFAQAWGVVNKEETVVEQVEAPAETPPVEEPVEEPPDDLASKIKDFLGMLEKALKEMFGLAEKEVPKEEAPKEEAPVEEPVPTTQSIEKYLPFLKERSVSMPAIYDQAYLQIQGQDPLAMMYDIYLDDAGMFAICASMGKLYKLPVTIKDGTVSIGKWEEIMVTQERKPSFRILRNGDGRYRWISVSATTVLNRSGEIDSRQLFDNIISRAEATGNYPIRVFFHAGSKFRTGQCDFLGRDENVLVTSGLYDQTELAQREVKARLEEPDFWGDSISFYPMSPAQKVRANNVDIPVYTDGILEEISTLPEEAAASWLTATPTIVEVQRMLSQRQMNAFVKLFDTEDEAKQWLEQNAATRNKVILETGMITRAKRELEEMIAATPEATPVPEIAEVPAPTDDAVLDSIADRVIQRMDIVSTITPALTTAITNAVTPIGESITGLVGRVEALEKRFEVTTDETTKSISQALNRLSSVEKTDTQKKREWLSDMPEVLRPEVTHRPRETRDTERLVSAEETLKRVPAKY